MRRYKAVDINWDVDDPEDLNDLPTEIEIPEELSVDLDPNEPYLDDIDDYLSDVTGFLHCGYRLVEY